MASKTDDREYKLIESLMKFRDVCLDNQQLDEDHQHDLDEILQSVPENFRYSALTAVRDKESNTILHIAMQKGYIEIVRCLLNNLSSEQQWYEFNHLVNKRKRTALTYSVSNRLMQKTVLEPLTGAQRLLLLTQQDISGKTMIHQAVVQKDSSCILHLSEFLSQTDWIQLICKKDWEGQTAARYAVETLKLDLLQILRKTLPPKQWSEILKVQDREGKTLVHYAATLNPSAPTLEAINETKKKLMKVLVDSVSMDDLYEVVKVADRRGGIALHANYDWTRFLMSLLPSKTYFELLGMADKKGMTLMHIVAKQGDAEMMKFLLEACSQNDAFKLIKVEDNDGNSVLHHAFSEVHSDGVVKLLMKVVPEKEVFSCMMIRNRSGYTPLHYAAHCALPSFTTLIKALDVSEIAQLAELKDDEGCTILHRAALNNDEEIFKKLINYFKSDEVYHFAKMADNSGMTSVHCSAAVGNSHVLSTIFSRLPSHQVRTLLWVPDKMNRLPMHHAALSRCVATVQLLLKTVPIRERQRMLKTEDIDHQTALDHALAENDEHIFHLISQEILPKKHALPDDAVSATASSSKRIQELEDSLTMYKRSTEALEILVAAKIKETSGLENRVAELEKLLEKKSNGVEGRTADVPMESAVRPQLISVKRRISDEEKVAEPASMLAPLKQPKLIKKEPQDSSELAVENSQEIGVAKGVQRPSRDELKRDKCKGKAPKSSSGERLVERNAIPPELEKKINELCRAKGVKGHILLQNPKEPTHIAILGSNTSKLLKEDVNNVTEMFPDYKVSLPARKGRVYNQQLAWRNSLKVERFGLDGVGTCEMIASATDNWGEQKVFIVGTAHMMFTRERNEILMEKVDIQELRNEVQASPSSKVYHFRCGRRTEGALVDQEDDEDDTNQQLISTHHPPLIGYRYNYTTANNEDRIAANVDIPQPVGEADDVLSSLCRNDMALLPFDVTRAELLQQQLDNYQPDRTADLVCIDDRNQLIAYNRPDPNRVVDIAVKGFRGRLVDNFFTVDYQLLHGIGHFLMFELDGELTSGDSGSILYEVEANGNHHPLGMVTGSVPDVFGEPYYEAIILNKAFEDIVENYESINSLELYAQP